jgi:membrane-anchored glycerophosphoryl diester phosphodiesterase (GDPDase)
VQIVFLVLYVLLWIQFLKRGLEIYVLKIGIGIACCGLMDSDGGVFKPYIKKFFQEVFSVLLQVFFLKLSIALLINGNILFGIAAISASLKAPQFLQEFIMAYGGGQGVVSKSTQAVYMANMVRGFAK